MVKRIFYYANLTWVRGLLFFVASTDVKGKENVPRTGPVILAFNHMSNGDPPVLTGAMPRRLTWMVKAEWFKTPVVGQLFRLAGMIPVRRFEADLQALRRAQEALEDGGALGMFPEGHRSGDKGLQKGEPGTALIALRTGAPIVPTAIWGTEHVKLPRDLLRRTRAHVRFGKPFRLDTPDRITREAVLSGTETIMKEIAALLPEQHRGVYKDVPTPEGAIPKTE
ncbi:MAG: lysophospholipid acyltransferase family protein [Dehalococcoidia bacterium]